MNAAGLALVISGTSANLEMAFYQNLVTDGSIKQDELDGTRRLLSGAVETLRNTPAEKIEAMVAQYNEDLTAYSDKFNAIPQQNLLERFQVAQIMAGFVTTIMSKSGLRV